MIMVAAAKEGGVTPVPAAEVAREATPEAGDPEVALRASLVPGVLPSLHLHGTGHHLQGASPHPQEPDLPLEEAGHDLAPIHPADLHSRSCWQKMDFIHEKNFLIYKKCTIFLLTLHIHIN